MSYQNACLQCERPFDSRRPGAETCSDPCKYQRWIEKNLDAPAQPVATHPLQEVREQQATKKHNRELGGLIRQAIVDRLKTAGECHCDDLVSLYPEGEVAECRRLATAQFGSLAKLKLIHHPGNEWRPTAHGTRKGGGGWVWKFTEAGRQKYGIAGNSSNEKSGEGTAAVAHDVGTLDRPGPEVPSGDSSGAPSCAAVPGGKGSTDGAPPDGASSPVSVEPAARLFGDESPSGSNLKDAA